MAELKQLEVCLCGIPFKNPLILASGTCGYGLELRDYIDLNRVGGISVKGLSLQPCKGNPMPRIVETSAGLINAIGLENVGVNDFINNILPDLKKFDTVIIANFWGKSIEEYVEVARLLDASDIDMLEMNVSCPNIKEGGISFGTNLKQLENVTNSVKKIIKYKPLIVKLSPNVGNIATFAKAAENSGADCISAINTILAMSIDINTFKPRIANVTGGLSGPAIKPIAVRMVYEIYKSINIPIIGLGGIMNYMDVLEFFLVGSKVVQIGTANFINPDNALNIINDLKDYLNDKKIKNISELTGKIVV
jgi:dihydroorotate dehydrogenase (NAD+) catalytic subunit